MDTEAKRTEPDSADRERMLGEAFAAYIMSAAAQYWGTKLCQAVRLNEGHPDARVLSIAADGLVVAMQRSNRYLARAVKRAGGGFDDEALRRLTLVLEDLHRRYLGLSKN